MGFEGGVSRTLSLSLVQQHWQRHWCTLCSRCLSYSWFHILCSTTSHKANINPSIYLQKQSNISRSNHTHVVTYTTESPPDTVRTKCSRCVTCYVRDLGLYIDIISRSNNHAIRRGWLCPLYHQQREIIILTMATMKKSQRIFIIRLKNVMGERKYLHKTNKNESQSRKLTLLVEIMMQ